MFSQVIAKARQIPQSGPARVVKAYVWYFNDTLAHQGSGRRLPTSAPAPTPPKGSVSVPLRWAGYITPITGQCKREPA